MRGLIISLIIAGIAAGCSGTKNQADTLSAEDAEKNLAKYEEDAAENPADANAVFKLARAHAAKGENEAALNELEKVVALDSNFASAYLLRAEIHRHQGRPDLEYQAYLDILDLPHGHNYVERIAGQIGAPFAIRPMAVGSGNNASAKFSPDGSKIVWQSDRDGNWNIYMARADGSIPQAITDGRGNETSPAFSPDGRAIVFATNRHEVVAKPPGEQNREIYLFDLSMREEKRLTRNETDDWAPVFYPDSSSLIVVGETAKSLQQPVLDRRSSLFLHGVAEAPAAPRVFISDLFDNTSPVPLPDGRLAWVRIAGETYSIVASAKPGTFETLYVSEAPMSGLAPSPDGKTLALFSKQNENIDLYLLDLTAKKLRRLTCHPARDLYPAFSPDGGKIVFTSDRAGRLGLFVLDLQEPISRQALRARIQAIKQHQVSAEESE